MDPKLLVVCPLKKELTFLSEGFSHLGWELKKTSAGKLQLLFNHERRVAIAVGGHGKVQFGIQTNHLINSLGKVEKVFCVGAGGGLVNDLEVGDIVVAEKTIEHDYAEKFNLKARLPEFFGHDELVLRAKKIKLEANYKVHFGAIASGDEDITDADRADELFERTNALAVAWEGVGGARACKFNEVPFLEMRAITDNARNAVAESFHKNLQSCMKNTAQFIDSFLA